MVWLADTSWKSGFLKGTSGSVPMMAAAALSDQRIQMGLGGATECHGGDLRADHQHTCAAVVLGDVFGHAEHRGTTKAALLVHHEAFDRRREAEQPRQLVVGTWHVHTGGGAEDNVGDL